VVGKDAAAKALAKVAGGLDSVEQEQIRNLFRNSDGTYRAYMCHHCKFGPVDHGWCNNLSSHNEEKKAGGGVVKNSCPRCNWFVSDIGQWPRWDGNFATYNGPKVSAPVTHCPFLCHRLPRCPVEGGLFRLKGALYARRCYGRAQTGTK